MAQCSTVSNALHISKGGNSRRQTSLSTETLEPEFHHFPAEYSWASYLICLCLCLFIYKWELGKHGGLNEIMDVKPLEQGLTHSNCCICALMSPSAWFGTYQTLLTSGPWDPLLPLHGTPFSPLHTSHFLLPFKPLRECRCLSKTFPDDNI